MSIKTLILTITILFIAFIFILGIALIVISGNDHEYLDYPPEEMEWDKECCDDED